MGSEQTELQRCQKFKTHRTFSVLVTQQSVFLLKGRQPISNIQRNVRVKPGGMQRSPAGGAMEGERKDGRMDGAQYRPVMEGLDRPAAGGRDWELLIGEEKEVGAAHGSMGASD